MPWVLTNVIFILFAATYDVTPSVAEHNYCQPSSRVKSDFVSHSCQTDLTMEDIAAMEARISIPTRPAFDELVTKSDDSVSFYTGFPGKDTLNGEMNKIIDAMKSLMVVNCIINHNLGTVSFWKLSSSQ